MSGEVDVNTQRYMDLVQQQLETSELERVKAQNQLGQISSFSSTKEPNLAELQLELDRELDRIYHLLSGHQLKVDSEGSEIWSIPSDDRLQIFSEYGVKQIMNLLSFYINKNTILSIYDLDTIKWKVRDFATELADLIYLRYESFFSYPSPEELYDIHLQTLENNDGINISPDELYEKCLEWSDNELKSKIRHYPSILLALVDSVDATYRRALSGETLKSLRTQAHIMQNLNPTQPIMPQPSSSSFKMFKPTTWGKS